VAARVAVVAVGAADVLGVGESQGETVTAALAQKQLRVADAVLVSQGGQLSFQTLVNQYILE
jgi:hypothetical protein